MAKRAQFSYENRELSGNKWQLKRTMADHEQWVEAISSANAEAGQIEAQTNRRPLLFMAIAVVIAIVVMSSRLFYLQIVQGHYNLDLADGNRIRQEVIRAPRGIIYDSSRHVLVRNQANYDVIVVPAQLPRDNNSRQKLYEAVAGTIGVSASDIISVVETKCEALGLKQRLSVANARLDCLGRVQPQLGASNVDREKALLFDQRSTEFPAFSLDVNPIRQYMDNSTLPQVLGYTGRVSPDDLTNNPGYQSTDYIGKLGIEQQYENELRGINGSKRIEVDVTQKPVKVLASQTATPGNNLVLSIDTELEQHMSAALQEQLDAAKAKGATTQQAAGVAIDPRNGNILALVSLPSYDGNLFARGISQADYSKLASNINQPLFNKSVSGAYPTGSIIKPLIASAALQERVVTPSTTVNDKGSLQLPNPYDPAHPYIFRSYEPGGFGPLNITDAIRLSSNVFFYTMGGGFGNIVGLGVDRLTRYYREYGLGGRTGIDLPGETPGLVPTPAWKQKSIGQPWYVGDTYNISVGQGELKVSPLQMASAIATVANGGTVYKPHLVTQVLDNQNQVIKTIKPEIVRKTSVSADNYSIIQNAMRLVVSSPTGTGCCRMEKEVPVHVAGKTGTAETGGYAGTQLPHAWFEAYAPYEHPNIVVVCMVANSGEGAVYALPAVRETLTWYFTQGAGAAQK